MAHIEHRPIWYIAQHTGHHGHHVRQLIAKTLNLLYGRRNKDGQLRPIKSPKPRWKGQWEWLGQ
jgi:hypothetical protein